MCQPEKTVCSYHPAFSAYTLQRRLVLVGTVIHPAPPSSIRIKKVKDAESRDLLISVLTTPAFYSSQEHETHLSFLGRPGKLLTTALMPANALKFPRVTGHMFLLRLCKSGRSCVAGSPPSLCRDESGLPSCNLSQEAAAACNVNVRREREIFSLAADPF